MFWKAESLLFHLETMFLIEYKFWLPKTVVDEKNSLIFMKIPDFHEFRMLPYYLQYKMCKVTFIADGAMIYHNNHV